MADPPSPTGVGSPIVVCADEQDDVDIDAARWAALAEAVLRAEGAIGELTLTFVDPAEIAVAERRAHGCRGPDRRAVVPTRCRRRQHRRATPSTGHRPCSSATSCVCPAIAATAAPDHGGSVDDELALLVVHGILHVLGHDHAEPAETAAMRERERVLLSELHWHGPVPATFQQEQAEQEQSSRDRRRLDRDRHVHVVGDRAAAVRADVLRRRRDVVEPHLTREGPGDRRLVRETVGARAVPTRQSSGAVHQPDPRDDHVLPDRSGVPHVAARRPAVRRHRCHHRLLPERHLLLRAGRGDAEDVGGAVRRARPRWRRRGSPNGSCRSHRCAPSRGA